MQLPHQVSRAEGKRLSEIQFKSRTFQCLSTKYKGNELLIVRMHQQNQRCNVLLLKIKTLIPKHGSLSWANKKLGAGKCSAPKQSAVISKNKQRISDWKKVLALTWKWQPTARNLHITLACGQEPAVESMCWAISPRGIPVWPHKVQGIGYLEQSTTSCFWKWCARQSFLTFYSVQQK